MRKNASCVVANTWITRMKPRRAHLRYYDRLRFALQYFDRQGPALAVAEEPGDVACLRYGRARSCRDREADAAAQDPVPFVRQFGRAARNRTASGRFLQQRRAAGRVPAGIAGRFGRPGSAGQHVPAAAGPRRSGVQGCTASFGRSPQGVRLEALFRCNRRRASPC